PDLRALYEAATLFLFPSETEGFGLPPVEAMQCGTATVAARGGAIPEVCGTGAELVTPTHAAEWVGSIRHLLDDPQKRQTLDARGRARAAELTWTIAGDRLWRVIEPML
ncbi:MAG: glycosyltransferase, partial [Pseudomonadota bacterium]